MTLRDWAVLLKVARGEVDAPCGTVNGLIVQGLVQRTSAGTALTEQGRLALGLAVQRQDTRSRSAER